MMCKTAISVAASLVICCKIWSNGISLKSNPYKFVRRTLTLDTDYFSFVNLKLITDSMFTLN